MYRNPILVRKITHLTDARYFAAMGVDWISMELSEDLASFMRWHTLRDWVEGLKLIAEISSGDDMLLAKTVIDARPDGLLMHNQPSLDITEGIILFVEMDRQNLAAAPPDCFLIIPYHAKDMSMQDLRLLDPEHVFLEADWTPELLQMVINSGYAGGICFTGGQEDATGVRDYAGMDELLSVLDES